MTHFLLGLTIGALVAASLGIASGPKLDTFRWVSSAFLLSAAIELAAWYLP